MSIKSEAMMEAIEELSNQVTESGADPMTLIAVSMNSMAAIHAYQKKLEEKTGPISSLLKALAEGGFVDGNGSKLTDSFTFKMLTKQLESGEE